jgi:TonB family protein
MFAEWKPSSPERWRLALLISFAAHGCVLLLLSHHGPAASLLPKEVALGTPYSSGSVIYLAPLGREQARDTQPLEVAKLKKPQPELSIKKKAVAAQREQASKTASAAPEITARGGSPYGSHVPGSPLTGDAVMPALPQVFPDPPVSRAELPPGLEGDVIVEVTIDEHGNVTELKLAKGIGFGIDEKVLAVLRQWHFRPATRNGVSIASQHLVHFHYPA